MDISVLNRQHAMVSANQGAFEPEAAISAATDEELGPGNDNFPGLAFTNVQSYLHCYSSQVDGLIDHQPIEGSVFKYPCRAVSVSTDVSRYEQTAAKGVPFAKPNGWSTQSARNSWQPSREVYKTPFGCRVHVESTTINWQFAIRLDAARTRVASR